MKNIESLSNCDFFRHLSTNELFELLFNSHSPIANKFKDILKTTGVSIEEYRASLEMIRNKNDRRARSFIVCIIQECSPLNDYSIYRLRWEYIKYVYDRLRDIKIDEQIDFLDS